MIKFPHINLLRNVLAYVDKVNNDPEVPAKYRIHEPVTFLGTVKLHGSNCGVVFDVKSGTLTPQSRETTLSTKADYKGFARFVEDHNIAIRGIFDILLSHFEPEDVESVALYGEWVGKGVISKTKGVAVSKFDPKHWALFGCRVHPTTDDSDLLADPVLLADIEGTRIGSLWQLPRWTLTIDFNDPSSIEAAKTTSAQVVDSIAAQCPYGALYGLEGPGEGVVWTPQNEFEGREDLYWKAKSKAHSVVFEPKKVKHRPPQPTEAVNAFVEATVTPNRLEQGLDALEQQGLSPEKRNTGKFIQWLSADVQRECALELAELNLTWAQVSSAVATKARIFFLAR